MLRIIIYCLIISLYGCKSHHPAERTETFPRDSYYKNHSEPRIDYHALEPSTKLPQHLRYKQKQDRAPKGPIPISFKSIVPKNEPLSRYGNPTSYNVMGAHYEVMRSATGYHTQGLASWYGTKFHKERTSSGEKYDMYALTAAHKTLPLPTYIKVKNLENGKEAIIKVNDRGPFHEGRVLDLSYGSSVKLGLFPKGTAMVDISVIPMNNHVAQYCLQAGAFQKKSQADSLKSKLAELNLSPIYVEKYNENYVVRLGPYASKNMVDRLKYLLASHGVQGAFSVLV